MKTITLSDAAYDELSAFFAGPKTAPPVVTPPPVITAPPVVNPPARLILPAVFGSLHQLPTTRVYFPPLTGFRIHSKGLHDDSAWVIWFKTGEMGSRPRFRGAEDGSSPSQRVWAIVRRSDNQVIATGKGSTSPSIQCVVGPSATPYLFSLEPFTEYALAVRADPRDSGTGNMYMDLTL